MTELHGEIIEHARVVNPQVGAAFGGTHEFTFHALDREIRAMPEGPTDHKRPKWMSALQAVGALGMILAVIPSFLILKLEPAMWMAHLARAGVVISILGWGPQFVYDTFWVVRSMISWRAEQTRTLDHEFRSFGTLHAWLNQFPTPILAEHARFTRMCQLRLKAKLGFLAGGWDKLAIIPLIAVIAVQVKLFQDYEAVPLWQVILGVFAGITYAVAIVGHLMHLRLGLYEAVLTEALERRASAVMQ